MQKFNTLDDAIRLAEYAHFNQKDKAGLPYIKHPERVLAAVQAQGAMPYVQMAAILHDVPEDTRVSHDVLLAMGFSEAVVKLTKLLDRDHSKIIWENCGDHLGYDLYGDGNTRWLEPVGNRPSLTKDEYYYACIKDNPDALMIKLADIGDNLQPWRLNYLDEETQKRLREKYARALEILNPKPVNHGFIATAEPPIFNPFVPGGY